MKNITMKDLNPLLDDEKQVSYLRIIKRARKKYSFYLLTYLILIGSYFLNFISLSILLLLLFIESASLIYGLKNWKHIFYYSVNDENINLDLLNIKGEKKEINLNKDDFKKIKITHSNFSIEIPQFKDQNLYFDEKDFNTFLKLIEKQ